MAKRLTPEEYKAKWEARQAKIRAHEPRTFKQFCAQCQQTAIYHMNLLVYGTNSPNRRTGTLKRRERLIWEGETRALLVNDAKTGEGYPYALAMHEGRRALSSPTRRGRFAYAWLWNRAAKRPGPNDGAAWRKLVKAGKAVVTPNVKASAPRPWRTKMLDDMEGKWSRMASKRHMEIFKE